MTDVVPSSHHPVAPSSHTGHAMSTRSSDGTLARQQSGPDAQPLGSPRGRLTRKRAASINTEEANQLRIKDFSLSTSSSVASSQSGDGARDLICLCTPAPKVPRPRNAFILYRQHHQAQVVARHPGLANPEISKIIGEQWRDQPEEIKDSWKRLAEEEKARHQRQYPDYRYQPRRGGKGAAVRPTSTGGEDPGRCGKCGGRYIATPRTPSTPFMTPTASEPVMLPYITPNPRVIETDHIRYHSPNNMQPYAVKRPYPHHGLPEVDEDYEMMSPTSDHKRRRFDGPNHCQAVSSSGSYHQQRLLRTPSLAIPPQYTPGYGPGGPLPGPPSLLARRNPGPMPPPPRPSVSYNTQQPPRNNPAGFDESLRLPPLQTQVPTSPTQSDSTSAGTTAVAGLGISGQVQSQSLRDSQARSIEAMVMSIPYTNKLNVLGKISPPLAPPAPGSPAVETRGPVIAIEGANAALLLGAGTVVEKALLGSGECAVRVWSDGLLGAGTQQHDDEEADADADGEAESDGQSAGKNTQNRSSVSIGSRRGSGLFASYLQTIMEWHGKSEEIVKHVTTLPPFERPPAPGADGTVMPQHGRQKVPVALLAGGFSLTISDKFASSVPIADSYAPVDHWQWMATLWRGIVGPDLVIYVKAAGDHELDKAGGVEFKTQGIVLVRVHESKGMDEKTERRLGFEVMEWVRNGAFREGFAKA